MTTFKKLIAASFTGLIGLSLAPAVLSQAAFPSKPIRIVVGFPAGGPLDQHARLLTDKLQGILVQPVTVDYKAGAGGIVEVQDLMKAAPDGYTLMPANTGVILRLGRQRRHQPLGARNVQVGNGFVHGAHTVPGQCLRVFRG